jgi:hypothetical protein
VADAVELMTGLHDFFGPHLRLKGHRRVSPTPTQHKRQLTEAVTSPPQHTRQLTGDGLDPPTQHKRPLAEEALDPSPASTQHKHKRRLTEGSVKTAPKLASHSTVEYVVNPRLISYLYEVPTALDGPPKGRQGLAQFFGFNYKAADVCMAYNALAAGAAWLSCPEVRHWGQGVDGAHIRAGPGVIMVVTCDLAPVRAGAFFGFNYKAADVCMAYIALAAGAAWLSFGWCTWIHAGIAHSGDESR